MDVPAQTPKASSDKFNSEPRTGMMNMNKRPRILTVPMASSMSWSSAWISGATATMALVPQIAVPAPIKMAVLRNSRVTAPSQMEEAMATVRHASVISSARMPIEAMAPRFKPAPVRTIDVGITLPGMPRALSMTYLGKRTRLRTAMPARMAMMAALNGYRMP